MAKRDFCSRRAPLFDGVPDEDWNNWRWQLSHRLNTVEEIEQVPYTERLVATDTYAALVHGASLDPEAPAISFMMSGDTYDQPIIPYQPSTILKP